MSEPHIIIDGNIHWDSFVKLCQRNDALIRIYTKNYQGLYLWPRSYSLQDKDLKISPDKIICFNGPFEDFKFEKEDNVIISHGVGCLYLQRKQYNKKDTGQTEEDCDGRKVKVYEELKTFKLIITMVEIWERKNNLEFVQ